MPQSRRAPPILNRGQIRKGNYMYKLILASASARRSQILSEYGIPFEVIKSDCEEYTEFTKPS